MQLTAWLVEPLYKQKKIRLVAITSFESDTIKTKTKNKRTKQLKMSSTSDKDSDSEEKVCQPVKVKSGKKPHKRSDREVFNEEVCSTSNYIQRELLWSQLEKVPLSIRSIAEKFLVYLVLKQKDNLVIRSNGTIVVNNHEIPGSNISKILTNILSSRSKTVDAGELAVLTMLKYLPPGL